MKRRTFISLMGVMAAAGVLGLTGCSSKDTASSTAGPAPLNKLNSIQKSGKLVVALEGAWQPWSYHDASDTLVGYDVEVSRAIAEKLGVEPEYVESDWDSLFAGLDAGRYDMVCNGVEVTDANYKTLGQYVYDGSVEIAVSQVTWEDNGTTPVLSSKGNLRLGGASFTDPAIYMDKVVGIDGTDKKVGYLLYMGFNIDYDDELMAAFETSLAPVALSPVVMQAVALGVEQNQITTFLLPVQANNHPIYNPSLDYSVYLSQPFFFVLFQVLILLITVYTVGIEIKFRTANDWLTTAKGNIVTAVLGKLLPYTIIYILIGWLANYVMFGILHIPFQGSWWLMNIMTVLFIIATQALGLFLFSLFPAISLVISVVSMVGSLGATLSGVTFPVPNMYPLVRDASYLFPVRHFTEMMQTMLYGGGGFIHLWPSAVILCIFPLLALLLLPHLKRAIESHKYENIK